MPGMALFFLIFFLRVSKIIFLSLFETKHKTITDEHKEIFVSIYDVHLLFKTFTVFEPFEHYVE